MNAMTGSTLLQSDFEVPCHCRKDCRRDHLEWWLASNSRMTRHKLCTASLGISFGSFGWFCFSEIKNWFLAQFSNFKNKLGAEFNVNIRTWIIPTNSIYRCQMSSIFRRPPKWSFSWCNGYDLWDFFGFYFCGQEMEIRKRSFRLWRSFFGKRLWQP